MNPELQRNLWLEITPHRLALVPAVIVASAALVHAIDPTNTAVRSLSVLAFMLLAVLWGARLAANSVLEEAREHTWDIQRMAALSPWSMTWGKLFGATVMAWYGGGCCLVLYLVTGAAAAMTAQLPACLLLVAMAVIAQGAALVGALVGLRRGQRAQARLSNFVIVLLVMLVLKTAFKLDDDGQQLSWYGERFSVLSFSMCAAVIFAAWAVLGAVRAMCIELQLRTRPLCWIGFALFAAGFATGFTAVDPRQPLALLRSLLSAITLAAIVQSYIAAFAYPCDPIPFRRVMQALRSGSWDRALEELPLWVSSAVLALVAALAATIAGSAPALTNERLDNLGASAFALTLMMLRDVALLIFFSLQLRRGRGEATTLVYLAVLDGLLPALLPRLGLEGLVGLLLPAFFAAPMTAVAIMAIHAAIAAALAIRAYRTTMGTVTAGGG